jgi:hypothetical protein
MANTKEGWVEEHMGGSKWAKSYIVLQSNFLLLFSKPPVRPHSLVMLLLCYCFFCQLLFLFMYC